jgi:hypothetical protein
VKFLFDGLFSANPAMVYNENAPLKIAGHFLETGLRQLKRTVVRQALSNRQEQRVKCLSLPW